MKTRKLPPMLRRRAGFALGFALTTALALGLAGCKKPAPPLPPPTVQVMDVAATDAPASVEFIGQLDSPQNIEIRARVEAFVKAMPFREGTNVAKDALLFELDDGPYQQRLAAAEGMLAEAKAALNKYNKDVARLEPLFAKRAIPEQDLDNARASVEVGKASVLSAQARVDAARLDLSYCKVLAPTNGLIGAKQVSVGELVGKGTPTLMATMSTLDPIWFYCNISEVEFLRAETETKRRNKSIADLPVKLILADGSTHPATGKFVFIDRAVDVKTGTIRVRAEFANAKEILRPGMFGRINVDLGVQPNSILVPERAVAELQGKNFVWVIDGESKATQRPVKVGKQIGDRLTILEGLKAGDRIVVEGIQKVKEGAPVQALTAEQAAQAKAAAQATSLAAEAKGAEGKAAKE